MADKPLLAAHAVREATFERWWLKAQDEFLIVPSDLAARRLAQAAWRRAWGARNEPAPWTPEERAEYFETKAIREQHFQFSLLLQRYGVLVHSFGKGNPEEKIRAYRHTEVKHFVETDTHDQMLIKLKDMAKRGEL